MSTTPSHPTRSDESSVESVPPAPPKPAEPDALVRLKDSRARLGSAMLDIAHPPAPPPLMAKGIGGVGKQLRARARRLPGVTLVLNGVDAWWQKSPARKAGQLAGSSALQAVASAGRKKPQALLLTSAAAGALLFVVPWRLLLPRLLRATLFSGVIFEVAKSAWRLRPRPPRELIDARRDRLGLEPRS